MATYTVKRDHIVHTTVDELWAFLSKPNNLKKLTPKKFGGRLLHKDKNITISQGLEVKYRFRLFLLIPFKWTAKFVYVKPKSMFIDEQVKGPFKSWRHTHSIIVHRGHVIMRDEISFEPPFPYFQDFIYTTFIVNRLHDLFNYRDHYFDAHFKQT